MLTLAYPVLLQRLQPACKHMLQAKCAYDYAMMHMVQMMHMMQMHADVEHMDVHWQHHEDDHESQCGLR